MDFIKSHIGGQDKPQHGEGVSVTDKKEESGGGGLFGKLNDALGGGQKSEQNEDGLDKAVDWVQEHVLHQGAQSNESAIEQAKDEQISDAIRNQYKSMTGKDFFVKDKEH